VQLLLPLDERELLGDIVVIDDDQNSFEAICGGLIQKLGTVVPDVKVSIDLLEGQEVSQLIRSRPSGRHEQSQEPKQPYYLSFSSDNHKTPSASGPNGRFLPRIPRRRGECYHGFNLFSG